MRAQLNAHALDRERAMHRDAPESDWKAFRELREVALQRFCERALKELLRHIQDVSASHHERYLAVFRLLQERDEELAAAFNDPARSRMILQLALIHAHGLLTPEEFGRFTAETRRAADAIASERAGGRGLTKRSS